jgi:pyruvate carboxylase
MPGGQFTNLVEQARSLGLADKWPEVAKAYAEANQMFGDIVKVTPSSKVVGDMALMMVTQGLTRADVENPDKDISFPESVVGMMRGDLGQPPGGWPEAIRRKALKDEPGFDERPGARLAPVDLEAVRAQVSEELEGKEVDDEDLSSYLMYPKVYMDYMGRRRDFGPVRQLPTPVFFYGMETGEEVLVDLEPGKTLVIRLSAIGESHEGEVRVFFELNGQPRTVRVPDRHAGQGRAAHPKAEPGNPRQVGAPLPGAISGVSVEPGQKVRQGDLLLTIEAMKMETGLHAERDGVVRSVLVAPGAQVDAKDLLVEYED